MSADLMHLLARLATGATLSEAEAEAAFGLVMDGAAGEARIAALLMALRVRGETAAELRGAVRAMRARMSPVAAPAGAVDVCGTGGDAAGTLNVSTAVAFVVAGCGVPVAKHGNRGVSSRSGGADVLAALGVALDGTPAALARLLVSPGLAFLFAPAHHPGMRHAAPVRAALGVRTIFNLLGPLANPAGVRRQLTGVYDAAWLVPMAETLGALGAEHVWLVHGAGLDELTLAGQTQVVEWRRGALRRFTVTPEDAGFLRAPIAAIAGGDAAHNAAAIRALLAGAPGAYRDTVLLNAAAALIVAGVAGDLREGAALAAASIDDGRAGAVLAALMRQTELAETMS
jgi:anthranilate phosphoribosyltransferase/anthranilate synthase/phosphoribosyltransferase